MKWTVFILILTFAGSINAQNNPAMAYGADYVVLEVHMAEKSSAEFAFLFETNEQSYNKKPFVQQFMDLAYDKSLAYDSWSINRKKENMRPVNYNNVDIIELKYAVFYKNGEPVYHHLAGIEVDEFIDYDGVDNEYYQTIFSVSDQNSLLMYYLDSRFIPGKEKLTYWEFFNQVFEDDICIPSSISFLSLNETEKLCNRNVWEGFTDKNATFNLPKKISDQAKIEIKLIRPEIEDSIMFNSHIEIQVFLLLRNIKTYLFFCLFQTWLGIKIFHI
jgi:hypothetical protein